MKKGIRTNRFSTPVIRDVIDAKRKELKGKGLGIRRTKYKLGSQTVYRY
jgi:hypothetical protein